MNRIMMAGAICVVLLLCSHNAEACGCIVPGPRQALEVAEVVFTGKVVDINEVDGSALLEVYATWKGLSPWTKKTKISMVFSTCYYELRLGEEYLLYARKEGRHKNLLTDMCYPNRLLAEARRDLLELGRPRWGARYR